MADSKKYNGSTWKHSLRKLTTATDTLTTLPTVLYPTDTTATVGLKGQTVQNGTPTPTNPIQPQSCGDLETTDEHAGQYKIPISSGGVTTNIYLGSTQTVRPIKSKVIPSDYSPITATAITNGTRFELTGILGVKALSDQGLCTHAVYSRGWNTFNAFSISRTNGHIYMARTDISTVEEFREWLADQSANGTPVRVWYAIATPETATVNEPLMKIGDYADEVSGITIPVTAGANTLSVDTTVQPSEFTATWTGWHNATVKELKRTANIYDKYNTIEIENVGTRYGQYVDAGIYSVYNNTDNIVYWGANDLQARQVACNARSTATFTISGTPRFGIFMPYNDDSLGEITIVKGSVIPDHYIPYTEWK